MYFYLDNVPLGSIKFTEINSILAAERNKQTSDLFVECNTWRKKNEEKDRRKFVFGAKNETERDEWITAIEYMKTKSQFDNFRKKFANITFPVENFAHKQKKSSSGNNNFDAQVSLGTMLKRQNNMYISSQNSIKKVPNSVRKGSFANYLIDKKLNSSFSIDSLSLINQGDSMKDLAQKIVKLYNVSLMQFSAQITENS